MIDEPPGRIPSPAGRACLRCKTVPLRALPSPAAVACFACPGCGRHFVQRPGTALCFRWPHPIGLALYPVMFDRLPSQRAREVAATLVAGASPAEQERLRREIALELADPTQRVGDIVACRAPEDELRRYLGLVVAQLEGRPTV